VCPAPPGRGGTRGAFWRWPPGAAEEAGTEVDALSLAGLKILPCTGCNTCVKETRCPQDEEDDMVLVKEKLKAADAVVFAAPSYFGGVPGVMKSMMDRSRSLKMDGHRLRDKVASALSLAARAILSLSRYL